MSRAVDTQRGPAPPEVAWVLGGGGVHGVVEVGMIRALVERGVRPDVVLGTSIGALNGALYAADPTTAVARLTDLWEHVDRGNPFEASLLEQASTMARSLTHLAAYEASRDHLAAHGLCGGR